MTCACECGEVRRPKPCGCACECQCSCDRDLNRPGLDAVRFGNAWYSAVYRRMRERLSGSDLPALAALTARQTDESIDPAIAVLEGWSTLSEVLSFYNERAVNESFLRTCLERRSAVELARLIGYTPRPGVAADAYLAFTLDDLDKEAVLSIPTGTRAYSQPGPGETMQPFETDEALQGRPRWSVMHPRLTMPQWLVLGSDSQPIENGPAPVELQADPAEIWLKGITTGLVPGSVLLFDVQGNGMYGRSAWTVEPFAKGRESAFAPIKEDQTRVVLQPTVDVRAQRATESSLNREQLKNLVAPSAYYPGSRDRLKLDSREIFDIGSYASLGVLGTAYPQMKDALASAVAGTSPKTSTGNTTVYAMRVKAAVHGHNAPLIPNVDPRTGAITGYREWNPDGVYTPEENGEGGELEIGFATATREREPNDFRSTEIALDAVYDQILPGSHVIILHDQPTNDDVDDEDDDRIRPLEVTSDDVYTVLETRTVSVTGFNLPARVTWLRLNETWIREDGVGFDDLRKTVVYAQSEKLDLVDRPYKEPLCVCTETGSDNDVSCAGKPTSLVLDGYYPGLEPGRRLIITGERSDLGGDSDGGAIGGVQASELVMITSVSHKTLEGDGFASTDTIHTYLTLAESGLNHCYKRDTVLIFGNVAHATHGESRAEVLGSGDTSRLLQEFELKQFPLTHVPAETPNGIESTLEVRVNDLRWREAPNAAAIASGERRYITRTNDDAKTTVITGLGSRLPTGRENIRATYRTGIGAVGNVRPNQISVLASMPQGVMGVTNPLATSGGADRDDLAHIRERAPIGLSALDRIVSVRDIDDFTRAFAGIGKARVSALDADGNSLPPNDPGVDQLVLAIAGENDVPLSKGSALVRNLSTMLAELGDLTEESPGHLRTKNLPDLSLEIQIRTAQLVAMRARIRLHPDEIWEAVLPKIHAALDAVLGFGAREIGQDVDPGIAIAAIQKVRGVVAVDLQGFGIINVGSVDQPVTPDEIAEDALHILGTDLPEIPDVQPIDDTTIAYLAPDATGTLLLSVWEEA
jgi:hypothetical protein